MGSKLEIPAQYVIGYRGKRYGYYGQAGSTDEFPLAFATYVGGSGFASRMETLKSWIGGDTYWGHTANKVLPYPEDEKGRVETIDNAPTKGFSIKGWTSRSTTDNKLLDIKDPRGFTLQIYIDNVFNLLMNDVCDRGVFQGEYVWGRKDGKNWLVSITDPIYTESLVRVEKAKDGPIKPVFGDRIINGRGEADGTYVADVYIITADIKSKHKYYNNIEYQAKIKRDDKPWFMTVKEPYAHDPVWMWSNLKRKWGPKDNIISSGNDTSRRPEEGGVIRKEKSHVSSASNDIIVGVFYSKEAMEAFTDAGIMSEITKYYNGAKIEIVDSFSEGFYY